MDTNGFTMLYLSILYTSNTLPLHITGPTPNPPKAYSPCISRRASLYWSEREQALLLHARWIHNQERSWKCLCRGPNRSFSEPRSMSACVPNVPTPYGMEMTTVRQNSQSCPCPGQNRSKCSSQIQEDFLDEARWLAGTSWSCTNCDL